MNEIGTFDILGPNMIGPSSSHTAGALRIAFVAGRMVERAVSVKFVLTALLQERTMPWYGPGSGGRYPGLPSDDERIRDSFEHAKEAGLAFSFEENFTDKEIYPNTVDIYVTDKDGSVVSRGENPSAVECGDHKAQRRGCGADGQLLHISGGACGQEGDPGLCDHGFKRLRSEHRFPAPLPGEQGKTAYAIIEVDTNVSNQVVSALKGVESVTNVLVVPAIQLD
mgnify:CR=1 FL=1